MRRFELVYVQRSNGQMPGSSKFPLHIWDPWLRRCEIHHAFMVVPTSKSDKIIAGVLASMQYTFSDFKWNYKRESLADFFDAV